MRNILVLGAGFSTPFLIKYLLDNSQQLEATVTVADRDETAAKARIAGHPRGRALRLDISDDERAAALLADTDLVVNLLPPKLQPRVTELCVEHGCHMVSASYRWPRIDQLHEPARQRGVAILTELGLDPGIDLMSAQRILDEIHQRGGTIDRFLSYGGGLPEPSFDGNALRYCITWNPRNVAMAASSGAQFLRRGKIEMQPWHRIFASTWKVDIPGLGVMDAYANRDSITYRDIHGIAKVRTLIRGTLRYPGYCQAWDLIVRLGIPNQTLQVPDLANRSWAELVEMFLPGQDASADASGGVSNGNVRSRTARFLGLGAADPRLEALDSLGLFSDEPTRAKGSRPADALVELLQRGLPLPRETRDMVVLHHEIDALYPEGSVQRREQTLSTFVCFGEPGGISAMATTVGFPAALGAQMILDGRIPRRGCLSPTDADIYRPILAELEAAGSKFEEQTRIVEPA